MASDYFLEKRAEVIEEADEVSLHTGDPGPDGLENEVTGGTPAYARVAITGWASGGVGVRDATLAGAFDVPADTDVVFAGLWNGAQFLDDVPALVNVINQDTVTITVLRYTVVD